MKPKTRIIKQIKEDKMKGAYTFKDKEKINWKELKKKVKEDGK
jgi:hypothetical protein